MCRRSTLRHCLRFALQKMAVEWYNKCRPGGLHYKNRCAILERRTKYSGISGCGRNADPVVCIARIAAQFLNEERNTAALVGVEGMQTRWSVLQESLRNS